MRAAAGSRFRLLLAAFAWSLIAACSSNGSDENAQTTTKAPTTTAQKATTTAVEQTVLADYRAAWDAYNAATASANPDDPGLPARMTAEQVQVVKTYVIGLKAQGLVSKGELELHPRIVDLTATTATILDCYLDTTKNYDAATGELKDQPGAKTFSGTRDHGVRGGHMEDGQGRHRRRGLREPVALGAFIAAVALSPLGPAWADSGGAYSDEEGVGSRASNAVALGGRGRAGGRASCTTDAPFAPDGTATGEIKLIPVGVSTAALDAAWPHPGATGTWYFRFCAASYAGVVWIRQAQAVDPLELARRAERYLPLPAPAIRMSPAGDQVVNLRSWLWIDRSQFAPQSSSVSAGPVTVTVTALPERVVWHMGDGERVECAGPGTPYDPTKSDAAQSTDCGYVYRRSSANQPSQRYAVTATIDWRATFTVTGAPGGGTLGVIQRSTTVGVRVGEVQAVNDSAEG